MKLIPVQLVALVLTWIATIYPGWTETIGFTTSRDGNRIKYVILGTGEPSLVFVSGWAGDSTDWDPQIEYFARSHRIVALDLPGFGASDHQRDDWSMARFGEDVVSVIEALAIEKAILVGHSMGAGVILEAAIQAPNRVIGLVPVDVFHDVEEKQSTEELQGRADRMMSFAETVTEDSIRALFPVEVSDEVIQRSLNTYRSTSKVGWREAAVNYFEWRNRLPEILAGIEPPIHCINSDRFNTDVEQANRYARSFQVTVVPRVGHAVMTEAPEEFNRALESIVEGFSKK
jgi:pimeloyl-ACP methyl ester carboxylesterase